MEPHRDEQQEDIIEDMIRKGTCDANVDVTHMFLNESGDGDESLGQRDESSLAQRDGEEEADGEDDDGSDDEADGSGEVHTYIK